MLNKQVPGFIIIYSMFIYFTEGGDRKIICLVNHLECKAI